MINRSRLLLISEALRSNLTLKTPRLGFCTRDSRALTKMHQTPIEYSRSLPWKKLKSRLKMMAKSDSSSSPELNRALVRLFNMIRTPKSWARPSKRYSTSGSIESVVLRRGDIWRSWLTRGPFLNSRLAWMRDYSSNSLKWRKESSRKSIE